MAKHQPSSVRRTQLFQAALQVCAEKGYHGTRVDDIAERAGLSKGSLYHHFGSKEELFLALFGEMIESFAFQMDEALADCGSPTQGLREAFSKYVSSFDQSPGLLQGMMEFYLLGVRRPHFRELFMRYYEKLVAATASYLRRGIEQGELRADIDPQELAWTMLAGGDGLVFIFVTLGDEQQGLRRCLSLLELLLQAAQRRQ